MATKLKSFSHSFFIKFVVFVMLIGSVIGGIYTTIKLVKQTEGNIEILFENNYSDTSTFVMENDHRLYLLAELIDTYKSEEHILAGKSIDEEELAERVAPQGEPEVTEEDVSDSDTAESVVTESESLKEVDEATIEAMKEIMIAEHVNDYKQMNKRLHEQPALLYHVNMGEEVYTNTTNLDEEAFRKQSVYFVYENDIWEIYPKILYETGGFNRLREAARSNDAQIYVTYDEDQMTAHSASWAEAKASAMTVFYYFIGFVSVFILSLIYLIMTTGRRFFSDKQVTMHAIDKLFVDVNIVFLLLTTFGWIGLMNELIIYYMIDWVVYVITVPATIVITMLLLSLVRHLKNKTFIKHMVIFIVLHWFYRIFKDMYDSGSIGIKVAIVVIVYPLLTAATVVFFPITIAVAVWLSLRQVKDFQTIQEGTKTIREGNLQHVIQVTGKGEFAKLADNINGIREGLHEAVHNELKNERMKTELITNVSHDIRTPLTSLITYTDLLKNETDPVKIKEYINILEQKSKRLQTLTDDLFAAAKASSGDIPVDLQQIDIVALMNQGIGEVSEQITAKNLTFKTQYAAEKMFVLADGKLLWRAIENILSNIFNYALEGSRVYIDVTEEGAEVLISFKNISEYELNITEDELMERFKRGDESRTSGGSGLGLSITKSLIENQHGTFDIHIDGDLFKSMIYLPISDETSEM